MQKKQGISLIVLVITIIVMIILAASVIIALSNTGVINRANEAVKQTNESQVQDLAALIWADAYMDGKRGVELETEVITKLVEQGIAEDTWNISVTDEGVQVSIKVVVPEDWNTSVREITSDGVPIPFGFVKSPYVGENKKNEGLVIYALTEEEISEGVTKITTKDAGQQVSLETRNQFVWVPVDIEKFETLFKRVDYINTTSLISNELGSEAFWELVLDSNNMPIEGQDSYVDSMSESPYVPTTTISEARAMYASVKKYGGFYIARYEAGGNTLDANNNGTGDISITMGKYPCSNLNAMSIARSFYTTTNDKYGVVSTLTYGVQWDRTLSWWKELDSNINLTSDLTFGNFLTTTYTIEDLNINAKQATFLNYVDDTGIRNWTTADAKTENSMMLLSTGALKKTKVYNIYDMAGNTYEITMEGFGNETWNVARGGAVAYSEGVAVRTDWNYGGNPTYDAILGFRPSLYIK